ncbi:MAG: heme o synthase [Alphaproteobacteria bacterium]
MMALAEAPRLHVATVGDYLALLKPRVMSLVVFTGFAGLILAPGGVHPLIALTAVLCIALGAGASGALNMAYESDIDSRMTRTESRPVPRGAIAPGDAAAFGWILGVGAVTVMALFVNFSAAALLAFTISFYVFVYTLWLKRKTPLNIVIGGLAGALPPAIGWTAVTGSLALPPLVLVLIVFLWTPPHFWALALFRRDDYARAGVPMLPVVSGKRATRHQILLYTLATVVGGFLPVAFGFAGALYLGVSAVCGAWFLNGAIAVVRDRDEKHEPAARRLFGVSIIYLFAIFAALVVERLTNVPPLV